MRRIKAFFKSTRPFKKLNAPYRMVFINDESLEEVASFHLTKRSVYILFSSVFVSVIIVTVAILLFTPLKYYIPGYASNATRIKVLELNRKVDSLSHMVMAQQRQAESIKNIIVGELNTVRDTNMLTEAQMRVNKLDENSILPKTEEIKKDALHDITQEAEMPAVEPKK